MKPPRIARLAEHRDTRFGATVIPDNLLSSWRSGLTPDYRDYALEFRCVLGVGSSP